MKTAMKTNQLRPTHARTAQIYAPQVLLSFGRDGLRELDERIATWAPVASQPHTVDEVWRAVDQDRSTASLQGSRTLTDWAATIVPDLDPANPLVSVAEALTAHLGLQVPNFNVKQLLDLSAVLIAHDTLSRAQGFGPSSDVGRTVTDPSVSEMVDSLVAAEPPADETDRPSTGERRVVSSGNGIGEYGPLRLSATSSSSATDLTQVALDNDVMPHDYDIVEFARRRHPRADLSEDDMTDPTNDYVQRSAADGYDDVHTALDHTASALASRQGSQATLAQSLDRGDVTTVIETVAGALGEEDMELVAAAELAQTVIQTASEEGVGRLVDGDASEAEGDIERAAAEHSGPGEHPGGGEDPSHEHADGR